MTNETTATYSVENMRIVPTSGKVKDKNPDRLLTVHGIFRAMDANGKPTGDPLTFKSKEVTIDAARNPLTVIDPEHGILTLPAGERGRKALSGIDADAVTALLASVREDSEPAAVEASEPVKA